MDGENAIWSRLKLRLSNGQRGFVQHASLESNEILSFAVSYNTN